MFNGDISKWDVSSVTQMASMFLEAKLFNGDISKWDVSRVTAISYMFASATAFNGDLSKWDVSRVTGMSQMFAFARSFNGDISKWDVSSVTDMSQMFKSASLFNSDISKWNVSKVELMRYMFEDAISFNGDVSKWDVSRVINMDEMFHVASSFKQSLCGADWVYSLARKTDMFVGSFGSISRIACMSAPIVDTTKQSRQYIPRQPITERELITRTPISTPSIPPTIANMLTCLKCGTFKKSGRVSCCAPGGAWYKNCGGAGNKNLEHRWYEGLKACERKFKTNGM